MNRSTQVVENAPVAESVRLVPRPVDPRPAPVLRLERRSDRWFLVVLLALTCVFAAVLGRLVFSPTVASLTGASDSAWTGEGP